MDYGVLYNVVEMLFVVGARHGAVSIVAVLEGLCSTYVRERGSLRRGIELCETLTVLVVP